MAKFVFEKVFKDCFYLILLFSLLSNSVTGQEQNVRAGNEVNEPNRVPEGVETRQGGAPARQDRGPAAVNRPVGLGRLGGGVVSSKIADNPDCQADVRKFCKGTATSNMQVLECLQDTEHDGEINVQCQHYLWAFKYNLTTDLRFETAAGEVCRSSLGKIPECNDLDAGQGLVIPCLIEYLETISDIGCKNFLNKMESVVFSDYRLVYKLVAGCKTDIISLSCGRLDNNDVPPEGAGQPAAPHGDTISCLMEKAETLQPACKHQILRLAELQSDDFNKDRQLFLACRHDRERLCSKVQAGNGQVYRCLFQHKFADEMSEGCKARLTVRQKLQRQDFKVNRGLAVSCKADIIINSCLNSSFTQQGELKESRLSAILLCLEQVSNMGKRTLAPECVSELKDIRLGLMSDYQLSPEIISNCETEVIACSVGGSILRNGKTLHCLMDIARKNARNGRKDITILRPQCRKALIGLMKEVNIRENANVDPVLQEACNNVINSRCSEVPPGKVVDCLMNIVNNAKIMTEDCKEKLMEIQYFVARDFKLSVRFYRSCQIEIVTCKKTLNIGLDPGKEVVTADQSKILLCVFRNNKDTRGNKECLREARKVMIDRASSVDLDPAVEDACMTDLASMCSDKTEKNDEMDCLEDHLDKLSEDCKEVIERFIEDEDESPELNEVFRFECEPVIKKHCPEAAEKGKDDDDDTLIQCLIKHKNVDEMNKKCRAQLNHHQIITMADYNLSHEFKEACKESVLKFCPLMKKKSEVVTCLSELVLNDTLSGKELRVEKLCRKQIKFELLQRGENIKLDPALVAACTVDIQVHCNDIKEGRGAIVACLRQNQKGLQPPCHELIFKREVQEANDPSTDFMLMTKCKKMIKKHCADNLRNPATIFTCLVAKKELDDFDKDCTRVIIARERLRTKDIRLNPGLMKECGKDVMKFCDNAVRLSSPTETEGRVLYCLRNIFAQQNQFKTKVPIARKLTDTCYGLIKDMIKESVLDHVQDRRLVDACKTEIHDHCLDAVTSDKNELGDRGEVIECLRRAYDKLNSSNTACLKEVTRVLSEEIADVQVDPLLYRACAVDIQVNCKDVPRGEGRHMSCLLELHSDRAITLRPECDKALTSRVKLWELAVKMAPPETVLEFANLVNDSTARNYLLAVIFSIIGMIFLGGLCCGRVTKRVASQIKNR